LGGVCHPSARRSGSITIARADSALIGGAI
jgi:hypothetical protein